MITINKVTDLDMHFAAKCFDVLVNHAHSGSRELLSYGDIYEKMVEHMPSDRHLRDMVGFTGIRRGLVVMRRLLLAHRYPNLALLVAGIDAELTSREDDTGFFVSPQIIKDFRNMAFKYHWDEVDHAIFYDKSMVTLGREYIGENLQMPDGGWYQHISDHTREKFNQPL